MLALCTLARQRTPRLVSTGTSVLHRANATEAAPSPPSATEEALSSTSTSPASVSTLPPPPPPPSDSTRHSTATATATETATPKGLESASQASSNSSDATQRRRPSRPAFTRRPFISLAHPRKWNAPVAPGRLPVYDEALKYIFTDISALKKELRGLRGRIGERETRLAELKESESESESGSEGEEKTRLESELRGLRAKAEVVEIQSDVNRPSVRWAAANGMVDLNKPVFRHLMEQKWRTQGGLDLLMERLYQMHVIPDLIPELHPSIDVRITFPDAPPLDPVKRARESRQHRAVVPGTFLLPEQTRRAPRVYASVFHPETRYYTMVLIDADVPDEANRTFTTYLHWLQPNIALSAATSGLVRGVPHTGYVPPHPQRGTAYHRYCLLLLPHADADARIRVGHLEDAARRGFDLRAFCATHGLDGTRGGGAHLWREKWDATVSDIYEHTLKTAEPAYGH